LTCRRPEKNLADGCPKCALTELWADFRDQVIDEITREICPVLRGSGLWPLKNYSFRYLLDLNSYVSRMLNENDEQVDGESDVLIAELADIVIAERRHAEKVDHYNSRPAK